jgi:hypothetical protein
VRWREIVAMLLGWSAYSAAPSGQQSLDSPEVERMREAMGGQLSPLPQSQTRWYLSDLEAAELRADGGDLGPAARLMRAARKDGVLAGVLSTRTAGLVRLPKRFRGDAEMIEALESGHELARSVFDEMFPASELALLAADGELLGVGVGELREVPGRAHPVFIRLDPEFLVYRWNENRWYYKSIAGLLPITPGDGRWILHTPGGRLAPWLHGLWKAVGQAFIRKQHAALYRDNWEAKLAHPARVAIAPNGAEASQSDAWFTRVMAWGVNTVFRLLPGYDVKLLESNGRGAESFRKTIEEQNTEIIIAVSGQTVTVNGGAGFQNSDIHRAIRADLIKATADALAFTINTQGLPAWIVAVFGEDALLAGRAVVVEWDITPPADREKEAKALGALGDAIAKLNAALATLGQQVTPESLAALCAKFGITTADLARAQAANERPPLRVVDREAA